MSESLADQLYAEFLELGIGPTTDREQVLVDGVRSLEQAAIAYRERIAELEGENDTLKDELSFVSEVESEEMTVLLSQLEASQARVLELEAVIQCRKLTVEPEVK